MSSLNLNKSFDGGFDEKSEIKSVSPSGSDSSGSFSKTVIPAAGPGSFEASRAGRSDASSCAGCSDASSCASRSDASSRAGCSGASALSPAGLLSLDSLEREILSCRRCALGETASNKVIMKGSAHPKIVFIGEAPGKKEDLTGVPFCGRAGKLLDDMISYMGLQPEDWAVINTVKCRPPNNRVPSASEMRACRPFFDAQLSLLSPRLIILLGNTAEKAYGGPGMNAAWGLAFVDDRGRRVLKIFHPAALIYQRSRLPEQYEFLDRNRSLWES